MELSRLHRRACCWVAVSLLLVTIGGLAHAQPAQGQPADASNEALAQSLFEAGRALMDEQRYQDACRKFEESNRLDPSAGTLLNLGRCLEAQGKTASAWAMYKQTIGLGRTTNKPRQVSAAEGYIADIEPRLAKLVVVAKRPVAGLRVRAGSVEVGEASLGVAFPIDPGSYDLQATAPDHEPFSSRVTIEPGATARATIPDLLPNEKKKELDPEPDPPPPPPAPAAPSPLLIAGIALGGAALASLGIGTAFGVLTLRDAATAEDDPALCPQKRCTPAGLEHIEAAETKAAVSTATLVIGGALAAGSATLIGVSLLRPGSPTRATALPLVGRTMGLAVIGSW